MEEVMIDQDRLMMETKEIFKYLDKKIYDKIPETIRNVINEYKGNYEFSYDTTKSLNEQNISQATKDLIVGLYYKYAANEEERKKIKTNIEKYESELIQKEKELKEKYSVENLFKNTKNNIIEEQNAASESQALIIPKESIFKKIFNKIMQFFRKG